MQRTHDVVVIGAGAIGLSCALALQAAGRDVLVLDAGRVGGGSSHGNCGTITPSHAGPLYGPGLVGQALRWMLRPDAPFYVRPRLDPQLWSWLLRFAARCNQRDWARAARPRAALLQASRAMFPAWVAEHAPDCQYAEPGSDYMFRDPRRLEAWMRQLPVLAELGIAAEVIDADVLLREEPALRPGVAGAVRFQGDAQLRPDRYVAGLARSFLARGGRIDTGCAVRQVHAQGPALRVLAGDGRILARDVVVATGAWSARLADAIGVPCLRGAIAAGKGYSITWSRPDTVPRRPLTLFERRVCVTVWDDGFRLGSTMEFSGYDDSLNPVRLAALEAAAREYLHVPTGQIRQEAWCGWRPVCHDDLPLIGRAPGHRHLWLATGHGMLGISMSPVTGQLLADLVCARTPVVDPAPCDPRRLA